MDDIQDRFLYHTINEEGKQLSGVAREEFTNLAAKVDLGLTDCREKSIAMTKLEEALMWINKGIAMQYQM